MSRRTLAVLAALTLTFALAACGDGDKDDAGGTTTAAEDGADSTTTGDDPDATDDSTGGDGASDPAEPIAGHQAYEGTGFSLTFPEDWEVTEQPDTGFQTALLTVAGPPEDGFASNLNLITVPGGNDGEFKSAEWGQDQADEFAGTTGVTNVEYEELAIGERDGFVLSYTIEAGTGVADGYQYYVAGKSLVYILTVTVAEGGDRTVADEIGASLRVT